MLFSCLRIRLLTPSSVVPLATVALRDTEDLGVNMEEAVAMAVEAGKCVFEVLSFRV